MKKSVLFIIFLALATQISSCGQSLLKKADIDAMADKNFYLTSVSVDHSINKQFFQTTLGIENSSILKDAFDTLPVDQIINILSDEFSITVNTDDFKKTDSGKNDFSWASNRKNINSLTIEYSLIETPGANFEISSTYLRMFCTLTLSNKAGRSKTISVRFPAKENTVYNPVKIAKNKKIKTIDVVKFLVIEDTKKIPDRLTEILKNNTDQ